MDKDVYIAESLHEPSTYFIFRPLNERTFMEIKLSINHEKRLIKCSERLLIYEVHFITKNLMNANIKLDKYITNTNTYDSQLIKKTYNKIQ